MYDWNCIPNEPVKTKIWYILKNPYILKVHVVQKYHVLKSSFY